jgi:hypothetical protein
MFSALGTRMRIPTGSQLINVSKARVPSCQSDNSHILILAGPVSLIGLAPPELHHLSLVGTKKCERSLTQKMEHRLLQKNGSGTHFEITLFRFHLNVLPAFSATYLQEYFYVYSKTLHQLQTLFNVEWRMRGCSTWGGGVNWGG